MVPQEFSFARVCSSSAQPEMSNLEIFSIDECFSAAMCSPRRLPLKLRSEDIESLTGMTQQRKKSHCENVVSGTVNHQLMETDRQEKRTLQFVQPRERQDHELSIMFFETPIHGLISRASHL